VEADVHATKTMARGALLLAAALALPQEGCKRKDRYGDDGEPFVRAAPVPPPSAPPAPAPSGAPATPPGMPPGGGSMAQVPSGSQIAALEAAAVRDPKSARAWIDLGNAYFDSHQPSKAIEAYDKALAIDPANPDVLTDQGVMYRDLKQYDKAMANFEKASKLDPRHVQSVFNLGVVASDLGQDQKAIQAWTRVIQMAPQSPQAAQARQLIDRLRGPGAR
jgi:tetratricopeptide (TPR) repeat protein